MSAYSKVLANGTHDNEHWQLVLRQDDEVESPRSYDTNRWTLTSAHSRRTLGDVQVRNSGELEEHLAKSDLTLKDIVHVPLYFMDHGSVAFSSRDFADQFDSAQTGVAYMTKADYQANFGDLEDPTVRARAIQDLDAELDTYNDWLNGETYGFTYETQPVVAGKEPDRHAWEEQDAGWGFIGSDPKENGMSHEFHPHVSEAMWPTTPAVTPVAPAPTRRSRGPGR